MSFHVSTLFSYFSYSHLTIQFTFFYCCRKIYWTRGDITWNDMIYVILTFCWLFYWLTIDVLDMLEYHNVLKSDWDGDWINEMKIHTIKCSVWQSLSSAYSFELELNFPIRLWENWGEFCVLSTIVCGMTIEGYVINFFSKEMNRTRISIDLAVKDIILHPMSFINR